jgi:hypothetical protein
VAPQGVMSAGERISFTRGCCRSLFCAWSGVSTL